MKKVFLVFIFLCGMSVVFADNLSLKWIHNYGDDDNDWYLETLDYSYNLNGKMDGYITTYDAFWESRNVYVIKHDFDGNVVWQTKLDVYSNNFHLLYHYSEGKVDGYLINCDRIFLLDLNGNVVKEVESNLNNNIVYRYTNGEHDGYYSFNRYHEAVVLSNDLEYYDDFVTNINVDNFYDLLFKNEFKNYYQINSYSNFESLLYYYSEKYKLNIYADTVLIPSYDINDTLESFVLVDDFESLVKKKDFDGNIIWEYGYERGDNFCFGMQVYDEDGKPDGYLFAGESGSGDNALIVKLDNFGNLQWQNEYGVADRYEGIYERTQFDRHIMMSKDRNGKYDGYYILVTEAEEFANANIFEGSNGVLLKYDFDGYLLFEKVFGGIKEGELDGWDTLTNILPSYDKNGREDGIILTMDSSSSNFETVKNKKHSDGVIMKLAYDYYDVEIETLLEGFDDINYSDNVFDLVVKIKNSGNTILEDNSVVISLPKGVTFVSSVLNNYEYNSEENSITLFISELLVDEVINYNINIKVVDLSYINVSPVEVRFYNLNVEDEDSITLMIKNPITSSFVIVPMIIFLMSFLGYLFIKSNRKICVK